MLHSSAAATSRGSAARAGRGLARKSHLRIRSSAWRASGRLGAAAFSRKGTRSRAWTAWTSIWIAVKLARSCRSRCADQLEDALGAEARPLVVAEPIGVIERGDHVVGVDDGAGRRIEELRPALERHHARPVARAGRAVRRIAAVAGFAQRNGAGADEADSAVRSRQRRCSAPATDRAAARQGNPSLLRAGLIAEQRLRRGVGVAEAGPGEAEQLARDRRASRHDVGDDRAMMRHAAREGDGRGALHLDVDPAR